MKLTTYRPVPRLRISGSVPGLLLCACLYGVQRDKIASTFILEQGHRICFCLSALPRIRPIGAVLGLKAGLAVIVDWWAYKRKVSLFK